MACQHEVVCEPEKCNVRQLARAFLEWNAMLPQRDCPTATCPVSSHFHQDLELGSSAASHFNAEQFTTRPDAIDPAMTRRAIGLRMKTRLFLRFVSNVFPAAPLPGFFPRRSSGTQEIAVHIQTSVPTGLLEPDLPPEGYWPYRSRLFLRPG